jgi:hypothetical protein
MMVLRCISNQQNVCFGTGLQCIVGMSNLGPLEHFSSMYGLNADHLYVQTVTIVLVSA